MAYAGEYTNEITQDYINSLSRNIKNKGRSSEASARTEALNRGLEGDPYESLSVSSARNNTANELSDLESNTAWNVAGLQRQERLTEEDRTAMQEYNDKVRSEQYAQDKEMLRLQNQYQKELLKYQKKLNKKSFGSYLGDFASNLGSTAAGYAIGSLI